MGMSRSGRRAQRIRESVRMDRVLASYGYLVHPDVDREQQFPCDLHGDGTDNKPSARVYPHSNSFYCWACARSRDVIALVREKEGLSFLESLDKIERDYGLPPLPWEEGDEEKIPEDPVTSVLDAVAPDPVRRRVERCLQAMTTERIEPLTKILKLWELFDWACTMEDAGDSHPMNSLLRALVRQNRTEETLERSGSVPPAEQRLWGSHDR